MKYYLILNLKRQSGGPIVTPEKGLLEMEKSKSLKGTFKVIGECDKQGNLLAGIAANNFSQPVKKTHQVATPKSKPSKAEALFASASDGDYVPDMDDLNVDSGTKKVISNPDNNGKRESSKTRQAATTAKAGKTQG